MEAVKVAAPAHWKHWNPGLDNDHLTLGDVMATLPGNDPEAISGIVKLFENPSSPIAFKGAISLERHDCVHILLGRGLLPQDEAFVIGYTMGTSKDISDLEAWMFKIVTKHLYPDIYKFSPAQLKAFNLGLEAGKVAQGGKIYEVPLETMQARNLGELRRETGVEACALRTFYACERELLPESVESKRLPL